MGVDAAVQHARAELHPPVDPRGAFDSILVVAGFRLRFAGVSARICSSKLAPSSTRMFSCAGGRKAPTGGDI